MAKTTKKATLNVSPTAALAATAGEATGGVATAATSGTGASIGDNKSTEAAKVNETEVKGGGASNDQSTTNAENETPTVFAQAYAFCVGNPESMQSFDEAEKIWHDLSCDDLPAKLAVALFDTALDMGVDVTMRLAGKIDDAAITETNADILLSEFLGWRLRRCAHTANAATMMQKWSASILRLHWFILTELKT